MTAPLPWEVVVQALWAVGARTEREWRMVEPDGCREQQADAQAIKRVVQMIQWSALQGEAAMPGWPGYPEQTPVAYRWRRKWLSEKDAGGDWNLSPVALPTNEQCLQEPLYPPFTTRETLNEQHPLSRRDQATKVPSGGG